MSHLSPLVGHYAPHGHMTAWRLSCDEPDHMPAWAKLCCIFFGQVVSGGLPPPTLEPLQSSGTVRRKAAKEGGPYFMGYGVGRMSVMMMQDVGLCVLVG